MAPEGERTPGKGTDGPLNCRKQLSIAIVPLMTLIVGVHAELLRTGAEKDPSSRRHHEKTPRI